jgi:hypothetical protein
MTNGGDARRAGSYAEVSGLNIDRPMPEAGWAVGGKV